MRKFTKSQQPPSSALDGTLSINTIYNLAFHTIWAVILWMIFLPINAYAIVLTPLDKAPSQVRLCPQAACPLMSKHPFRSGSRIIVYETSGSWARVSKFFSKKKIAKQFPGQTLPDKVAMWIPAIDLPASVSNDPSIKSAQQQVQQPETETATEEEPETAAESTPATKPKEKPKPAFSFVPRRPAIPTARNAAVQTETPEKQEVQQVASAQTVSAPEAPEVSAEPAEPVAVEEVTPAKVEEVTPAKVEEVTPVKEEAEQTIQEVAAVEEQVVEEVEVKPIVKEVQPVEEAKTEPVIKEVVAIEEPKQEEPVIKEVAAIEEETDSFGNPIVSVPKKLTKELKDKRLSKLPSKPNAKYDLKTIIAMRHHGLQLIQNGECSGISEGGRSLSLAGWIYLRCENDPTFRQFSTE